MLDVKGLKGLNYTWGRNIYGSLCIWISYSFSQLHRKHTPGSM